MYGTSDDLKLWQFCPNRCS